MPGKRCYIQVVLVFCVFEISFAQNLETIGQRKPLAVTGGINVSNIFYGIDGMASRRDPYSYFINGNLNLDLYGWIVPFQFTLSNQENSYQQPFNQYSLHPTYKWVTAHIGYTSMTFSPYTLNGHIFRGVGVDLEPSAKFKFSAMYGRLQRAVSPDTLNENAETAAFKRMGFGFKASYRQERHTLDVIVFHAQDQVKSIAYVPDDENILPQENLVLSIAGSKTFLKKLLLQAEFATSAMTRDTRAEESENNNVFSLMKPLYTQRSSSSYYNAVKSGVSYQGQSYTVGVGYECVAPGYRTLGAYYFNNDLENITANATKTFFQGKLNLAANAGTQRDNLDNTKISTMRRLVGSFNVGYTPSERLNVTTSYSNFGTFTNIRSQFVDINQVTPYDNLDTLNFMQLSRSANVNGNYIIPSAETKRQSVNINLAFQDASDKQGGVEQPSGSQFYNVNANYTINFVPKNLGVSMAFNYNQNKMTTLTTTTLGPTVGLRKSFFDKKVNTTVSTSWNNSSSNNTTVSRVMSVRAGGSYSVQKKHHLTISMVVLNRKSFKEASTEAFTEYTGTLGYSYSF